MPIAVHLCELGIGWIFTVYGPIRAREKHYSLVWYLLTANIQSSNSQSERAKITIHWFGAR